MVLWFKFNKKSNNIYRKTHCPLLYSKYNFGESIHRKKYHKIFQQGSVPREITSYQMWWGEDHIENDQRYSGLNNTNGIQRSLFRNQKQCVY